MALNEISVDSKEQKIQISNGYMVDIKFDPIYKRWYCDIYNNQDIVYAGVPLNVGSFPLHQISDIYVAVFDKLGTQDYYEPYLELGGRLALLEITNE